MAAERVAILTAMLQEMHPIARALGLRRDTAGGKAALYRGRYAGTDVVATVTGIGTQSARRATEELLDAHPVDHVLMVGIAGAVDPSLDIGSLVVPEVVIDAVTGAEHRPASSPCNQPKGRLLTTDELLHQPERLPGLVKRGIVAVDMETAAVASACRDKGVTWSVLRAISDRAGEPLTDDSVLGLSHPDGSAKPTAITRFLLAHPGRILHLVRLARGMRAATSAAAIATTSWLDAQAMPD
ncbi:MAG: 5'-methylthioadenosine/S-adenosylhomocysteine nucleosidase [Acidimicrobiales bacterium]|nr:MAG: hypothetical protein EDR02_13665 [Actinomycetota bacterium]MBV6509733.1 5'-methylthioadenosine/S-adenosylhomocysteine nucleosidase [Acidimicrobiales bacterium]RIK04872.1 MAG: hypothetical protein DCC48_12605 [Acidobacteriota bacterium]